MRALLLPVAALLLSEALLLVGHGLQLTLLPLRAAMEGFTDTEIAFTGSAYFSGFVLGCLLTPHVVRRAGHVRAFAVMASSYSAAALVFDLLPTVTSWLALRTLTGLTIAGLYMILESWLNERSTPETRGALLSVYTMLNLTMVVAGQQLVNFADPGSGALFAVSAIILSIALIPVSLTTALVPAPLESTRIDVRGVWRNAPVALVGSVTAGLVTGAFWALGPVHGRALGLETFEITGFMSVVVLGGALLQLPLGRLSDHYDRRLVLLGTALLGALLSVGLAVVDASGGWVLYLLAASWGACTMTAYAIGLAHANDHAGAGEFVAVGTAVLLVHGAAAAVGAPLASALMGLRGPGGLYEFCALMLVLFSLFAMVRLRVRVRPAVEESEPFRTVGEVTPVALEMDPRVDSGWASPTERQAD